MRLLTLLALLTLPGCTNLTKDMRSDLSSVSHKTTVTTFPPTVSSEWTFVMRPVISNLSTGAAK